MASSFISPSYNLTEIVGARTPVIYGYGYKDLCLVFFYTIVAVIFHAIVQEYILDVSSLKKQSTKTCVMKYTSFGIIVLAVLYVVAIENAAQSALVQDKGEEVSRVWSAAGFLCLERRMDSGYIS